MPPAGAGGIGVAKCEVGQEALGAASDGAASDGADDSVPVDGSRLGAERLGDVVAAGVLQATTAPPTEMVRARASRIRLNMMSGSSVARRAPPLRELREWQRLDASLGGPAGGRGDHEVRR